MSEALPAFFACPTCKGPLAKMEDGLECTTHGLVARLRFGVIDFLWRRASLDCAAGGAIELQPDAAIGEELWNLARDHSFQELHRAADRHRSHDVAEGARGRALRRFNERYARDEAEIGAGAGEAILNKVDPHLAERGLPPLGGDVALEAGGGYGLHLPAFAKRFRTVVSLDCSMVNLVMGAKLMRETGVDGEVLYVRADAQELPFRDGSIDFVHESGVIEHVQRPNDLVIEALRVLSPRGTYVCLSPNKFAITPEPHFRLPLFGIFPKALRRVLVPLTRGLTSEAGTDLLSLRDLRAAFAHAGEQDVVVYFLPRRLPETLRKTFVRRLIHGALRSPLGAVASFVLNRLLLPVMPYHIAVVTAVPRRPSSNS